MNRYIRCISVILIVCLIVAMPVCASDMNGRASIFFTAYGAGLYKVSRESFDIEFDVDANLYEMDELGVSVIEVYSSSDKQSWSLARTFYKEDWPEMTCNNTASHTAAIRYVYATPGLYYRAYVQFYARNSAGTGTRSVYTAILKM